MTPDDVISFWFGPAGPEGPIPDDVRARWWRKDAGFDEEIRRRFGELHAQALAGELDDWCATPRGCLALVIVLDQFSRNMHRDDPRAWAADPVAVRHCLDAIDAGMDAALPPQARAFLYMPLMHAEDRDLQARSLEVFQALARAGEGAPDVVSFAESHKKIVDRFGRFPHRNKVLGRATTAEEESFLKEPGSSF